MKSKKTKFIVELEKNGPTFRVVFAKQGKWVNQFKRVWPRVNAREVARDLNRSSLIIK